MNSPNRPSVSACLAAIVLLIASTTPAVEKGPRFTRTEVDVSVPDVTLINQNGVEVNIEDILTSQEPVFVDFIFASCTTICPILSASYSSMQRKLGDSRDAVRLVSITIDPEHDGPEELRSYLARYQAKPGWDILTGSRTDIDEVMRGFDAFVPDKMSHRPLVYIRSPDTGKWVQLYGFASSADLMRELELAAGQS